MPRLCELYPGIWLRTEEKARKNLSQGSWRVPVGKECTEQRVNFNKYINITIRIHNLAVTRRTFSSKEATTTKSETNIDKSIKI